MGAELVYEIISLHNAGTFFVLLALKLAEELLEIDSRAFKKCYFYKCFDKKLQEKNNHALKI